MITYNRAAWDDIEYLISRCIVVKKIFEYVSSLIDQHKSSPESTMRIADLSPLNPFSCRTFGDIYVIVRCTVNLDYQGSLRGNIFRLATPLGSFKLLERESTEENTAVTTDLMNALDIEFNNVTDEMYLGDYNYKNNKANPIKRDKYIPIPGYHTTTRFYRIKRVRVRHIV